MKKQLLIIALLLLTAVLPAGAVLKEKDINNTLAILRSELTTYRQQLELQTGAMKQQRAEVYKELISVLNKSQQNAIMLYSQKSGYVFDLTYACHEATEQYRKFQFNAAPFRQYIEQANIEVNRYDSLINDLSTMYVDGLSEKSKINRNVCLTLAINIRRTLNDNRDQMKQYVQIYESTEKRLKSLNDYANKRYAEIQNSIFRNGNSSYFDILTHMKTEVKDATQSAEDKYRPLPKVRSDWDSRVIIGFAVIVALGGLVAFALNYLLVGFLFFWLVKNNKLNFIFDWFLKKKEGRDPKQAFLAKRPFIILTTTVITFALLLALQRVVWNQNFVIMACGLLVEFTWLMGVILLSLLIRLDGDQIRKGFLIYLPIMTVCFIVISFRIILIPNDLVVLVFPPILLACAIWQWVAIRRYQKGLPKSDVFYTYVSQFVFLVSIVASVVGYTLLSVEILIWWTMQLTCILTITCVSSMLRSYGNEPRHKFFDDDTPITRTWLFRFIYYAVLPVCGALSVLISIYWAADVFNLSDTTWRIFNARLIDTKDFTFSIIKVVMVIVLYFVASYANHTILSFMRYHFWVNEQEQAGKEKRTADKQNVDSRMALWKNLVQVFIWGAWLLLAMKIFNINNSWLVAISAGLSTGIGFAMKDILENIYYGISLMAGRIKVGDYISIDGTRGTVSSISYVSTTLEALDGSIISFQNSQLFTKNYKNLTKNHGNELAIIPVGVAYGTNAQQARKVMSDAVQRLNRHEYIRFLKVVFVGFGDNSIDFKILAWVNSRKQIYAESDIMEAVYNALNEAHIEIPYPQRDIHIVSDTAHGVEHADSVDEAEQKIHEGINR